MSRERDEAYAKLRDLCARMIANRQPPGPDALPALVMALHDVAGAELPPRDDGA